MDNGKIRGGSRHKPLVDWWRRQPAWRVVAVAALLGLALVLMLRRGGGAAADAATFAARRGPLAISVLEGGSVQASESQEIKCELRTGYQGTKILKIVEEGYLVTEQDVKEGKVLVELDSSELQKQIVQQEIQFQSAAASLTDAQQAFEIQRNQNFSDLEAAEQKARFARMDFDKFLGDNVTGGLIAQLGLDRMLEAATNNGAAAVAPTRAGPETPGGAGESGVGKAIEMVPAGTPDVSEVLVVQAGGAGGPVPMPPPAVATGGGSVAEAGPEVAAGSGVATNGVASSAPMEEVSLAGLIDFSRYADPAVLGDGEAKQKLRSLDESVHLARKELEQATVKLEGTQRLFEKGFVTRTELQGDEIAHENSRLKVQKEETAKALYLKYEFLKAAEESASKYAEAVRAFARARKAAVSKLAQAEAKLKSAQAQYNVQLRQRKEFNDQLEKCSIRATKPGLVVYGGQQQEFYYGDQERIREGATVRERQSIITIPDMTKMSVKVKIHESYIKKVQKGQKVRVTIDAFPDKVLDGEVTKVGVLPDSQNMWMNPDMKVYLTTITVQGTHDWLKPGMSAKAEILVNRLEDVVYIPIQAVVPEGQSQVCYVAGGLAVDKRVLEVGEFNDEFIEVRKGLAEGERVLLRPPDTAERRDGTAPSPPAGTVERPASPEAAPAPAPTPGGNKA